MVFKAMRLEIPKECGVDEEEMSPNTCAPPLSGPVGGVRGENQQRRLRRQETSRVERKPVQCTKN